MFFVYADKDGAKSLPNPDIKIETEENDTELLSSENRKTESMISKIHFDHNGNSTEAQGN